MVSAQKHPETPLCVSLDRGANPGACVCLRDCIAVEALDAKQAQGNGFDCASNHPSSAPDQDGGNYGELAEAVQRGTAP